MNLNYYEQVLDGIFGYNSYQGVSIPNEVDLKNLKMGRNGADFGVAGKFRLYSKAKYLYDGLHKIDEAGIHHLDEVLDFSYAQIREKPFIGIGLDLRICEGFFNKYVEIENFSSGQFIEIENPIIRYDLKTESFFLLNGKSKDMGKFDWNAFYESIQNYLYGENFSFR